MSKFFAVLALGSILAPVSVFAAPSGTSGLVSEARDPILVSSLYGSQHKLVGDLGSDGAVGVNRDWETGARPTYYIEEQRYDGDLVQAGVSTHNDDLINTGIQIMQWGFKQQAADGSFPGTGDAFHSASLFVEGSARALIFLRETHNSQWDSTFNTYAPKVIAAAHWLIQPGEIEIGRSHDRPYAHRRWILATALAEAASLRGDKDLWRASEDFAKDGLGMQQPDGIDPEKGGYDVSYQVLGLMLASRYYILSTNSGLKAQIQPFIDNGMNWEITHINPDGSVNLAGSSRTLTEPARSGKPKTMDYRSLLQGLTYASDITGDPKFRQTAQSVAAAKH